MSAAAADLSILVSRGMPIFPCRDKKPLVKDWPNAASTDPAQIDAWASQFPGCQWAVVTGERSGVFVVDVDPRNGGDETLARLEDEYGRIETVTAQTPGGGEHLYLARPKGHRIVSRAGVLGRGVDVKGDGGYVIVPPSPGPNGRGYVWDLAHHPEDVEISRPAPWLLSRVNGATGTAADPVPTRGVVDLEHVPEGTRHTTLRDLTMRWAARGIAEPEVRAAAHALATAWGMQGRGEVENLVVGAFVRLRREGNLSADDADHERMIPKPDAVDLEGVVHPSAGAVEYLAVDLFPKSECTIIGATYKSGKTLFGYGAVLDLCTGRKVWGRFEVPEPVRCVVFQLEMPLAEDERRYRRIAIGSGMEPEEIPALVRAGMLVHYSRPDLDLTTPRGVRLFHDLVRDADAGLVYLDSIIAAFAGADLNDNSAVRRLFAQAFGPLTSEGRTIAANHHKRKAHANTQDDARSALLGAQAWGAAAGRIYGLERLTDGDDPHDAKNTLRCRLTLTGSWTPGAADDLILEAVDTPDGGTLIRALDDRAQAERGGVTATQRAALALTRIVRLRRVVDRKAALTEIVGDLDIRERAAADALKYAKAKGWIDSERKPGTTTNEQVLTPGPNAEDTP